MKKLLFILCLFCLNSCYLRGLQVGYKKVTPENLPLFKFNESKKYLSLIESNTNDGNIYAINGNELKEILKAKEKSIIYKWSPFCHSSVCITLNASQKYCDANGYNLFVVLDYYDALPEAKAPSHKPAYPLLISNHIYYKTGFVDKSRNKLIKDLVGKENIKSVNYSRFLFFEGDKFVGAKDSLQIK